MTRRRFMKAVVAGGAVMLAAVAGVAAPAVRSIGDAAARTLRAPADLLARIRRKTRPLDPSKLRGPHDLAG